MPDLRDYSRGPFPDVHSPLAQGFWDCTRRGQLCFPRCSSCGRFHFYRQVLCPYCQSKDIEWAPVSGRGRLFTWINLRYPFIPEYKEALPLLVALVEFDDAPGVRLITNLTECRAEDVYFGMPLEVVFAKVNEEVTLPLFKPARR